MEVGLFEQLSGTACQKDPWSQQDGNRAVEWGQCQVWLSWSCRECLQGSSGGSFCVILASAHLVPAEKRIELFENGSTFLGQKR